MSKTLRRVHCNKKRRFFTHYWEYFNAVQVRNALIDFSWMKAHQYYGDNYYTKSCKDAKQGLKNDSYRKMRRVFRDNQNRLLVDPEYYDECNFVDKPRSIKWDLH